MNGTVTKINRQENTCVKSNEIPALCCRSARGGGGGGGGGEGGKGGERRPACYIDHACQAIGQFQHILHQTKSIRNEMCTISYKRASHLFCA
jgi:hypothetical protein